EAFGVRILPSLEQALSVALEKDPGDRFPDARSFRQQLEVVLSRMQGTDERTTGTAQVDSYRTPDAGTRLPVAARGSRMPLWLAGGVVLALAGGAMVWRGQHATAPESSAESRAWPAPYKLAGVALPVDQTFKEDGLRIQAAHPVDVAAIKM